MAKYVYDKKTGTFQPRRFSFLALLRNVAGYLLASLLVGVVFYGVFALAFDTDREKQLQQENRLLTEEHDRMAAQLALLHAHGPCLFRISDTDSRHGAHRRPGYRKDHEKYRYQRQPAQKAQAALLAGKLAFPKPREDSYSCRS